MTSARGVGKVADRKPVPRIRLRRTSQHIMIVITVNEHTLEQTSPLEHNAAENNNNDNNDDNNDSGEWLGPGRPGVKTKRAARQTSPVFDRR